MIDAITEENAKQFIDDAAKARMDIIRRFLNYQVALFITEEDIPTLHKFSDIIFPAVWASGESVDSELTLRILQEKGSIFITCEDERIRYSRSASKPVYFCLDDIIPPFKTIREDELMSIFEGG